MKIENNEVEKILNTMAKVAIPELESKLASECARCGVSVVDVVGAACAYVVNGIVGGRVLMPESSYDLFRLMSAKAKKVLMDAGRAAKLDHGRKSIRANESLDEVVGECEREVCEHASFECWQESCRKEELAFQYRICRKVLDKVCELRKISPANQCIYKAVVLHEMPREEVALQYGTTRNNVDQIVSRVKRGLKEDGRWLYVMYNKAA